MAVQKIINGPSKWDLMLGFFENKGVTFTLEDGTVVFMNGIDAMWDMSLYESIDPDSERLIDEGYLLRGPDEGGDIEIFVEYCTRSRGVFACWFLGVSSPTRLSCPPSGRRSWVFATCIRPARPDDVELAPSRGGLNICLTNGRVSFLLCRNRHVS